MVRMKRNFVNESHEIMRTIILGMLGALLAATQSNAEDPTGGNWPRFRGPDGRGVAASQHVPVELGKNTLAWSVPLPGPGSSSPVVWGAALFVTGEDRKKGEVTLVCLDVETGGTRWSKTVRTGDYQTHNMNNTAASTPCLAENLVVFSWYDSVREVAMLSAFSHKGRELWQHEVGAIKVMHGINLQPVVQDGRVLFAHLHQAGGYVAALDAGNGKPVWRREYPQLSNKTTYITPLVRERHGGGKEVVVASVSIGVRGLDLATGEETWALSGVFKERTIVSPVDIMAGSGRKWQPGFPADGGVQERCLFRGSATGRGRGGRGAGGVAFRQENTLRADSGIGREYPLCSHGRRQATGGRSRERRASLAAAVAGQLLRFAVADRWQALLSVARGRGVRGGSRQGIQAALHARPEARRRSDVV